jgi:PAS domain S-box-containing protein
MHKKKKSEEYFKANNAFYSLNEGKRIEDTYPEIEEYLKNLFNYANAPIIVWNPQYEIIRFNKAFEFITGRIEKDVFGKSMEILFPSDSKESSMELIRNTVNGKHWEVVEINILHINGSVRTLLWNSATIMSTDGKTPIATIAQGQNITKRKLAEEEIRKLNLTLEQKIEQSEQQATELIITNKELAFQNLEKENRAEELIIANKELAFQNREKENRAEELNIANKELAFQNREKEKRAEELNIANKELAFQNREKENRAEELIIANKELAFQNKEKEKRAEELTMANTYLEQFAYIASHDLQEPLRTISNYIQVLDEDYFVLLDDNAKKYLHTVKDSAKRMSILIKSLLDFSRLGRNSNLTEIDCNKLIKDVITDLKNLITTSNAVIEISEMPRLNLYETEIRQLFQNLIINAIKFRKKDTQPKIQIRSVKMDEKWKFSVRDNGIGIAAVHFEKIFNIFQRIHSNEDEYKGNGIGLANCKKIVQLHHGEIWVESNLGEGATFYFTLSNMTV